MEKLPPELYDKIIEYIDPLVRWEVYWRKTKIAPYATISRTWQASIERYTFKTLTVRSDEFDTFRELFQGTQICRRNILKQLMVSFVLPDPPNATGCCDVTKVPDRDAESRTFSESVRELFSILSDLEQRLRRPSSITLVFGNARRAVVPRSDPWDYSGHGVYNFRCPRPKSNHIRCDVREARNKSGYYELRSLTMPILTAVDEFEFTCQQLFTELRPTWLPIVMRHLQGGERLLIKQQDDYELGRILRQVHRQAISQSLYSLPRDTLVEFYCDIEHTELRSHEVSPHILVTPRMWREEPWSCVIRHLADFPHLRVLHFKGRIVVCPEFFLNISGKSRTYFLSLEELFFEFAVETADGNWFCDHDEEAFVKARANPKLDEFWYDHSGNMELDLDSEDDMEVFEDGPIREDVLHADCFRSKPNSKFFRSFLCDASRFFKRLEKIRKFVLTMPEQKDFVYPFLDRYFELWWAKGGVARALTRSYRDRYFPEVANEGMFLDRDRLYWRTGDWIPWIEVQEAWIEATGPETKVFHIGSEKIESSDEELD